MWIFCTKMRKIHIFTILSSVLSSYFLFVLLSFSVFSSFSSFLNLMISLLRLFVDRNPSLLFPFLNSAQPFSSVAIRMVLMLSPFFSILPIFRIHGIRNSFLSSASMMILSLIRSFSTNRMSIPSFVLSTSKSNRFDSGRLMLKNVFFSS